MSQMCSGLEEEKEKSVLAFGVCLNTGLSLSLSVPGAPPRQVEVQTLNSTAIQVRWRSVVPEKQNGQVRGYQVHYACEQDGESRSLPRIRDIVLDDSQVRCLTRCQKTTPPTKPCHENGTSHRPFWWLCICVCCQERSCLVSTFSAARVNSKLRCHEGSMLKWDLLQRSKCCKMLDIQDF